MSLKRKIFVNTIWSVLSQVGTNAISLIANMVFARYLSVYEFGQLGIIMFFVMVANVLIEGGLGGALVRKEDATNIDFSTVFLVNLFISLFLYLSLFLSSGYIATYYNDVKIKNLLIAIGVILIINSFTFIQNTRLIKNLKFKKLFVFNLSSTLIATAIGIIMLMFGYGIWAIVITRIATALIYMVILWISEGGLGKLVFSKSSFKNLYAFGVNTSAAAMIDTIFNNIYQLVLGKFFSINEVGFFYQARKLQDVPNGVIFGTTNSVIFSSLAKFQNEHDKFVSVYRKIGLAFSVVMGLITVLVMSFAKEIILLLYGQKWLSSSFYLIILSLASFFYVHEMFNRVIYKIFDKTRIILRLEVVNKVILSISILAGIILVNIKVLLFGFLIASSVSYFINYVISRTIIQSKSWDELIYLLKVLFAIIVDIGVIFLIEHFFKIQGLKNLILFPIVLIMYFLLLWLEGIKIDIIQIKELFKPASQSSTINT